MRFMRAGIFAAQQSRGLSQVNDLDYLPERIKCLRPVGPNAESNQCPT